MSVTIEEINGKKMTVVWHDYAYISSDWKRLDRRISWCGCVLFFNGGHPIATELPALPWHPRPEDAPLLYRYMAEGVEPIFNGWREARLMVDISEHWDSDKITHAIMNRERVEIAIQENDND